MTNQEFIYAPAHSRTRSMILCGLFAALTAVGAFIRIPMPLFDYITLQTLFVLLAGMLLGAKRGALSLIVYLLVGLSGVPVFAAGGGIGYVLRPSFGFLLGFIAAAWLVGRLTEKRSSLPWTSLFFAGLAGLALLYTIGLVYKYAILNLYMGTVTPAWVIFTAVLPLDVPKDIFVALAAAILAARLRPMLHRYRG
ncbi:MAG TPA: biotin transporter BioY [Peptococcaceae bacterium]|nr:biotin transporter BioY [Peptococcaceae bacterium]